MIDLHMHTFFSDGVLIPSELVRRAQVKGYRAMAITDHVDASNVDYLVPRLAHICRNLTEHLRGMVVLPGVEITYVPLSDLDAVVKAARAGGAQIVVVHGETLAEPGVPGTNKKAVQLDIDILAHPGLITPADAKVAARRGVALEISAKRGHSLSNGHVARVAMDAGASLVFNSDTHQPEDLITDEQRQNILLGAGLKQSELNKIYANSVRLVERASGKKVR